LESMNLFTCPSKIGYDGELTDQGGISSKNEGGTWELEAVTTISRANDMVRVIQKQIEERKEASTET